MRNEMTWHAPIQIGDGTTLLHLYCGNCIEHQLDLTDDERMHAFVKIMEPDPIESCTLCGRLVKNGWHDGTAVLENLKGALTR